MIQQMRGVHTSWGLAIVCLACLVGLLAAAVAGQSAAGQLDSALTDVSQKNRPDWTKSTSLVGGMAVTFGRPDWQIGFSPDTPNASGCTQQVARIAARLGTDAAYSSVKLSPYFFYTWAMPVDAAPGEDKYYRHVVVRWLVRDKNYKQVEPTAEDVSSYITDFGTCISTAISLGFKHIFINPMIDADYNQDCSAGCPWRNAAEFDPTAVLPGKESNLTWSFESLVLEPTLQALIAAVQSNAKGARIQASIGFGGELGRSFTVFGSQWQTLVRKTQSRLRGVVSKVSVGPHFDPTKLCGYYCDHYSNATKVTAAQWKSFRSFLSAAREFGVSSYPNVWEQYDPSSRTLDVAQSARSLDTQLKQFAQTSIMRLRRSGKRFVFNELGLGGCYDWGCDGTSTLDIYALSTRAYSGQGSYENWDSPPKVVDPFRYMWTKTFRLEWYRQTLQLLQSRKTSSTAAQFSPDAAYVWSVGSWDIAAIYHPDSKGQQPDAVGCDPLNSYCDPDVLGLVRSFNKEGTAPTECFFNLPGAAYYQPLPAAARARSVRPEDVALPVDPRNVPGWAQPLIFSRPVWG